MDECHWRANGNEWSRQQQVINVCLNWKFTALPRHYHTSSRRAMPKCRRSYKKARGLMVWNGELESAKPPVCKVRPRSTKPPA